MSGDQPVTLMDGTHATLQVAGLGRDGSVRYDGSGTAVYAFQGTSSGANPGNTMAFGFLPHAMVTLSGAAVTPRSAAAIARSLRPL